MRARPSSLDRGALPLSISRSLVAKRRDSSEGDAILAEGDFVAWLQGDPYCSLPVDESLSFPIEMMEH